MEKINEGRNVISKQNKTWVLEDFPLNKKTIRCKHVFKNKFRVDGPLERYKEILVAKGYAQDYKD